MKVPQLITPAGEDAANLVDDRDLTPQEIENLAKIDVWQKLWNGDDPEHFVKTAYHPDVRATTYDGLQFNGREVSISGREAVLAAETAVKKTANRRRMEIERYIPAGNVVVVEAVIVDDDRPDFRLAWCGILTFKDGYIISDHSYANVSDWPGLDEHYSD